MSLPYEAKNPFGWPSSSQGPERHLVYQRDKKYILIETSGSLRSQ